MQVRIFEKSTLMSDGTHQVEYFAKRQVTVFKFWSMWIDVTDCDPGCEWKLVEPTVDALLGRIRAVYQQPIIRELEPAEIQL